MRVVIRIEDGPDCRVDELVEDPRVVFGRARLLRVPDLWKTESQRSAQATEEEPNLQARGKRRRRNIDIGVERLDCHVRIRADLAQSLCLRIDVLPALEERMVDASVFLARWVGEAQHVETVAEAAEAEFAQPRQVELLFRHRVLGDAEKGRIELVEELVGDPAPAARRRELEQTMLVAEVVDAHCVDDDILPRIPERPATVVVVGAHRQLVLQSEDQRRGVRRAELKRGEDAEPDRW